MKTIFQVLGLTIDASPSAIPEGLDMQINMGVPFWLSAKELEGLIAVLEQVLDEVKYRYE